MPISLFAVDTVVQDETEMEATITLSQNLAVEEGERLTINVTLDEQYADNDIQWHSNDTSVAIVINGEIIAKSVGQTTVTATLVTEQAVLPDQEDTVEIATTTVTVYRVEPTNILLSHSNLLIEIIGSGQVTGTVYPADVTDPSLYYNVADESIASIDQEGNITPLAVGQTTVILQASNGLTVEVPLEIYVVNATAVAIEVDDSNASWSNNAYHVKPETVVNLTAIISPSNVSYQTLTWKSSDTEVAIVQDGKVEFLKNGDVTITCTTVDGVSDSVEFEVYDPTLTIVVLSLVTLLLILLFWQVKSRRSKRVSELEEITLVLPTEDKPSE